MTLYEVRVTATNVNYYQIVAESKEAAQDMIRKRVTGDKVSYGRKVDSISRTPVIDYALQITPEGELVYDN